ncbi:MAG TPA: hypothetical protein VG320_06940 [Paraburkholderia sp.]|uniref:hypothetical protein n=1 Tax=Paraburkholderia sp. TaxID=1926495 RepID=UPI002DE2707D|nr:hypothetical protein [Paraburkholderia sp.]
MRIPGVLCGAAVFTLASMAAHADDFGLRDNGAPAQIVQHAQTHHDDSHERGRAAHWREERRRDAHAHDHHGQHEDSGAVFDPRRTDYRS